MMIEIQTVDGDGVDAIYRQPLTAQTAFLVVVWSGFPSALAGNSLPSKCVCWGMTLSSSVITMRGDLGRGLPSSQPLIVALGSSMGVESLSHRAPDGSSVLDGSA
ncbi:MAG: hypothetical protein R3C56_07140 [Pirellulaceae bacterium]